MFARMLVPLDGTPQSAAALPLARTLAEAFHSEVILVRVAGTPAEHVEASNYLTRIAREFSVRSVPVAIEVRRGTDAVTHILCTARDRAADLIVMATRGPRGVRPAVLGAVAASVVAAGRVPVLLVRPGGHRVTTVRTLLVPDANTPDGELALGIAHATGARIVHANADVQNIDALATDADADLVVLATPTRMGTVRRPVLLAKSATV